MQDGFISSDNHIFSCISKSFLDTLLKAVLSLCLKKIIYLKSNILMKFTFFRFIGIEVLKKLYSLNLSHNSISRIENLVRSTSLVELNLSMNELEDISYMPSMMNLQVLNLNNNKVDLNFNSSKLFIQWDRIQSGRKKSLVTSVN